MHSDGEVVSSGAARLSRANGAPANHAQHQQQRLVRRGPTPPVRAEPQLRPSAIDQQQAQRIRFGAGANGSVTFAPGSNCAQRPTAAVDRGHKQASECAHSVDMEVLNFMDTGVLPSSGAGPPRSFSAHSAWGYDEMPSSSAALAADAPLVHPSSRQHYHMSNGRRPGTEPETWMRLSRQYDPGAAPQCVCNGQAARAYPAAQQQHTVVRPSCDGVMCTSLANTGAGRDECNELVGANGTGGMDRPDAGAAQWLPPAPRRKQQRGEDCSACRALDCDMLFAMLFTILIAGLMVLIMVFWLKGIFSAAGAATLSDGEKSMLDQAHKAIDKAR